MTRAIQRAQTHRSLNRNATTFPLAKEYKFNGKSPLYVSTLLKLSKSPTSLKMLLESATPICTPSSISLRNANVTFFSVFTPKGA